MVRLENLTISFTGKSLFRDLNWRVGDTDRVGLVGANGSGKTTLLRLIEGVVSPDSGRVTCSKGTTYGYLPQEGLTLSGRTLFEEVLTVFRDLSRIEDRMRELEHEMADLPDQGARHDRVMREYADLQHEFEARDGFTIEARAAEVLAGLGFAESDRGRLTDEFSGGWQMRIALAKLLLQSPTVLLLDEPTNHLDLESIIWLEDYLSTYPGAVVLVSHDRSFLDRVVSRISELGVEGLVDYHGGYASFQEQREKRRETLAATRRQQERQIAHHTRFINTYRADKTKRALVNSRIKMIERIDLVEVPREKRAMHFQFPQPARAGSVIRPHQVAVVGDVVDGRRAGHFHNLQPFILNRADKLDEMQRWPFDRFPAWYPTVVSLNAIPWRVTYRLTNTTPRITALSHRHILLAPGSFASSWQFIRLQHSPHWLHPTVCTKTLLVFGSIRYHGNLLGVQLLLNAHRRWFLIRKVEKKLWW